jgi:nucleoside-diphosphate-sugar epimerase
MTIKRIVVTGAHSYLGQKVLRHLADLGGTQISAFITPWAETDGLLQLPGVNYLKADLRKKLEAEPARAIRDADHVLHFAWVRGKEQEKILEENLLMYRNIREMLSDPGKLVFISSVAASPATLSTYGKTKFQAANEIGKDGAVILVTGLIVDKEPKGPYKLLVDVVKKLPFSIRFTKNSVRVYPIRTDDFLNAITTVLTNTVPAGSYRVYPKEAADINDFLAALERRYKRTRIPLPVSYKVSMGSIKFLNHLGVIPASLGEKLLTFLYKDDAYLAKHLPLPGGDAIDRPLSEMI